MSSQEERPTEFETSSAHSLPDSKWFVSKISIRFPQISFHRDSPTQSSLRHLLCHRSRSGLPPCPPRCKCGVWYCGPQNPSRAPLYFIRTLRFGVHKVGVHHWPSTDHSCWQPPFTSIQGSLWGSSGFSVRTGPICLLHFGCSQTCWGTWPWMLTSTQITPNCMAIAHLPVPLSWLLEFFELLTQFTSGCPRTGSLFTLARLNSFGLARSTVLPREIQIGSTVYFRP